MCLCSCTYAQRSCTEEDSTAQLAGICAVKPALTPLTACRAGISALNQTFPSLLQLTLSLQYLLQTNPVKSQSTTWLQAGLTNLSSVQSQVLQARLALWAICTSPVSLAM